MQNYEKQVLALLGLVAILAAFLLALVLVDLRLSGFTSSSH
jgi:hypothetical protein